MWVDDVKNLGLEALVEVGYVEVGQLGRRCAAFAREEDRVEAKWGTVYDGRVVHDLDTDLLAAREHGLVIVGWVERRLLGVNLRNLDDVSLLRHASEDLRCLFVAQPYLDPDRRVDLRELDFHHVVVADHLLRDTGDAPTDDLAAHVRRRSDGVYEHLASLCGRTNRGRLRRRTFRRRWVVHGHGNDRRRRFFWSCGLGR